MRLAFLASLMVCSGNKNVTLDCADELLLKLVFGLLHDDDVIDDNVLQLFVIVSELLPICDNALGRFFSIPLEADNCSELSLYCLI